MPGPAAILTLVRHGETSANVDGVWHGSTDTPLTQRGLRQARQVARYLAASRSDARGLYASPLARARLTAEAIGRRLGLAPRVEADLREYHLGSFEGLTYRELIGRHRLFERMRLDPDHAPGGGESPRRVAERFAGALRRIAARHPGERAIVVGHGGALTLALGWILDRDAAHWRRVMDNCAVTDLVLEPEPRLLCFNERAHLEVELLEEDDEEAQAAGASGVSSAAHGAAAAGSAPPQDEALEARVLAFVRERDFVTFAALHKHFAGDAREEAEILLPGLRVVWAGLPKPVIDAVLALLERGALAAVPAPRAAYVRDGRVLDLPVEKRPPPHPERRWFPVWLRPIEAVRAETRAEAAEPEER